MKYLARLAAAFCGLLAIGWSSAFAQSIATSYSWTSTGPIISAKSDSTHNIIAVKDPSAVLYNGRWVIYASTVNSAGDYGMEYLNVAEDWSDASTATPYFIDNGGTAPQVFYFAPQNKWYLIYQWTPQFSTNSDPTQPQNWTSPKNIGVSQPSGVNWLDFWVICDSENCYLFFCADNGNFYRASTPISNFPNGFSTPEVVASSTEFNMFEADNVYSVEGTGEYLANIECLGPSGQRYFRALWASSLGGTWQSLGNTDNFGTPFLGEDNVTFNSGVSDWTTSFSSGGLLIDGNDQTDSVNPNNLVFLYQGANPTAYANDSYGAIPWQLGLATSKANTTVNPSFTLSRSASTLAVTQGSSATDTISVTAENGFSGSVTLAASGLPSGVTATFGTNPTTGSSVVTFAASSTAAAGTSTVTISGTSGSLTASTTISLTVTSGVCTPTAITPYISVSGTWIQESSATVSSTSTAVDLGPQPTSGGSWSWTGPNGFTSTAREIDNIPLSTGVNNYVATYTNTSSCKSSQTFAITVTGSSPGFSLTPSASTLSVKQGASGTDTITLADTGGFTGSVAFTVSGLPSGVTAAFSPTSSTTSSVLTLTASSTATTGAFTVTVTGTSGSTTASTTFTLDVTSSAGSSACTVDYTISPQNSSQFGASITIINGGSTTLSNWVLTWSFANGQTISSSWNGTVSQSGANVTVSEQAGQSWQNIPAGGSYTGFGFNSTWNGTTNTIPVAFSLNGTACTVN
jgi:hypothetical protein